MSKYTFYGTWGVLMLKKGDKIMISTQSSFHFRVGAVSEKLLVNVSILCVKIYVFWVEGLITILLEAWPSWIFSLETLMITWITESR